MSTDSEKQKDEIIVLKSIYNEEEFSYHEENQCYQCTFKIFINLPKKYHLTYKDNRNVTDEVEKIEISHLPPISLFVTLPENYPSQSPPKFTIWSNWLRQSDLTKLCKKLDKLWEENKGQEIMFVWVAFLKDDLLYFLNIQESLNVNSAYTCYKMALEKAQTVQRNREESESKQDSGSCQTEKTGTDSKTVTRRMRVIGKQKILDKRAISDCPVGRNPIQSLLDYNEKRNQIEFKKNFYMCKICFCDKSGEHCTQFLPCSHVFCKECISGYLEVRIKEGSVQNICCPEEKCTSDATPGQIKDLLNPELFAKYDSILLSATLDTMTDIVYCPRRNCQYPVSCESNEQMASCPVCQYTFCIYCKMVYHGVEPCKVNSAEKQQLVNEYQTACSKKRLEMEQRYGKKQIQMLVENTMSENWINHNSHNCPHCHVAIEKSDGCNKMTCWRCNTFFCWLCGIRLDPKVPYSHFQNTDSKCFNQLYQGVIPEENDVDDENHENDDYDDPYADEDEYFQIPYLYREMYEEEIFDLDLDFLFNYNLIF